MTHEKKTEQLLHEVTQLDNAIKELKKTKKNFKLGKSLPRAIKDIYQSQTSQAVLKKSFNGALDGVFNDKDISAQMSDYLYKQFMFYIKVPVADAESVFENATEYLSSLLFSKTIDLKEHDPQTYEEIKKNLESYQAYRIKQREVDEFYSYGSMF